MADLHTHADSVALYLTGAASSGASQPDQNLSLGGYRAAEEVQALTISVATPITGLTIDYASAANGPGNGTLSATGADTIQWTPPGDTAGPAITILDGETKVVEGADPSKYLRVTRSGTTALSGSSTVTLAPVFNNVIGFDNVTSAEASSGDIEYRAVMLRNESTLTVKNLAVFVATLGTSKISDGSFLGSSGAGTISLNTGNFNDWPDAGFCRIEDNLGNLKEIVYYSSRTSTALTVPAAGRALLDTAAAGGAATDVIYPVPGIRIGVEVPASGAIQTVASENTAPTGITWSTAITAATGIQVGDLAPGAEYGLWIERVVPQGATAMPSVENAIAYQFDSA